MKSAIVHPNSILGQAVQERLQRSPALNLERLLTTRDDEFGTLSAADEGAALIQELTGDEADLYFVCGAPDEQRRVAEAVRSGVVIHVEPTAHSKVVQPEVVPAVAGASRDIADGDDEVLRLHCPSPIAVALTHLLRPLADLDLFGSIVALRGASSASGAALDELLEQTRSLLSFSSEMPTENLKTQLAFNAIGGGSTDNLEGELDGLLPGTPLSTRVLDVGIFHGVGLVVDLHSRGEAPPDDLAAEIRRRLSSDPYIEARDDDALLGTVDAAGSNGILLAEVVARRHGAGLWAVFDNVTLAARNAVDLAEELPDRWLKVN